MDRFDIGASLRAAREGRAVDLAEAERETRIRTRYLDALERERFDLLPGDAYARVFLSTYARYLGLDGGPFVAEYDARFPSEEPLVVRGLPPPRSLRRYGTAAVVTASVLILALAWTLHDGSRAASEPVLQPTPARPVARAAEPVARTPPRPTAPATLRLVAVDGPSWLEARVGSRAGRPLYYALLEKGASVRLVGRRLWLRLGAPGNLAATLNGRPLPLPAQTGNVLVSRGRLRVEP